MKYTYIICLALSSFFTYKQLIADTNAHINAFFIPGGAFQQNTQTTDIQKMKPRYSQDSHTDTQQADISNTIQSNTKPSSAVTKQAINTAKQTQEKNRKTAQTTQKTTVSQPVLPSSSSTSKNNKSKSKPTSKYTLQDDISAPAPQTKTKTQEVPLETQLSKIEEFEQKSIKEMLNILPSPDFKLPKYQQIYALYGLELRSAYRRGKLPANYEQEATLAKANSIRRFPVK